MEKLLSKIQRANSCPPHTPTVWIHPAPAEFCIISETVFDLSNDLLDCKKWDPLTFLSPCVTALLEPIRIDNKIAFGLAKESDVKLDLMVKGGAECYIDDGACAVLDTKSNWRMLAQASQAVVMALFPIFRPLTGIVEPTKCPDPVSIKKMLAEEGLNEIITFLG